jgi:hypothetical protein
MTETNGELKCHICGDILSLSECKYCHNWFCPNDVSKFDETLCAVCVQESNTKIESQPLVGDDGVRHQGRKLVLTGEAWMRNRELISQMTDIELEQKLISLKYSVHEAEMIFEFRKIALSSVESEKETRHARKTRRRYLLEAMDQVHKSNKVNVTDAQAKVDVAKDALNALKRLGLNKDAMANVLLMLAKKEKPKTP